MFLIVEGTGFIHTPALLDPFTIRLTDVEHNATAVMERC
jgi:hypothetical protein